MREIVKARHVLLEFNGRDVLNISELSVAENEKIGLIGANGSGKTSLLRILSGDLETAACRIVRYGNVLFVPQVSVEDSHHMVPTDYMASIWGVKNCELIPQLWYCQELCANTTASLMKLVRRRPNRPRACSAWLPVSGPPVVRQGWRSHLRSP